MLTYNYAYDNNFYNKTSDEFLAYIQNDLTYFGETFSTKDYETLIELYKLFENDLHYASYLPFDKRIIK